MKGGKRNEKEKSERWMQVQVWRNYYNSEMKVAKTNKR